MTSFILLLTIMTMSYTETVSTVVYTLPNFPTYEECMAGGKLYKDNKLAHNEVAYVCIKQTREGVK